MKYRINPAVVCVQVSPDEIIARGGHLDGFSVVITDETGQGLSEAVLGALGTSAVSAEEVMCAVGSPAVTLDDVGSLLEELRQSGVVLASGDDGTGVPEWNVFVRFGHLAADAPLMPLTIAGGRLASATAQALRDVGLEAEHVSLDELRDLAPFAVPVAGSAPDPMGPERGLLVLHEVDGRARLLELNERAVAENVPVLYAGAAGAEYVVGPYVRPGDTACYWEAEHQRARACFSHAEDSLLRAEPASIPMPSACTERAVIAAVIPAAIELALLRHSSLAGSTLHGRATTGDVTRHRIMRLPRCPVCLSTRPLVRNPLY